MMYVKLSKYDGQLYIRRKVDRKSKKTTLQLKKSQSLLMKIAGIEIEGQNAIDFKKKTHRQKQHQ